MSPCLLLFPLAVVPGLALLIGTLLMPDTPTSLLERKQPGQALKTLQYYRGTEDVAAEFACIQAEEAQASAVTGQWSTIIKPYYRPQLTIAILLPAFQQLSGINCIMFYAPQIFASLGNGSHIALLNTVIINSVNVLATIIAIVVVDM